MLGFEFGFGCLLSYWVSVCGEKTSNLDTNIRRPTLAYLCNRETLLYGEKKVGLELETSGAAVLILSLMKCVTSVNFITFKNLSYLVWISGVLIANE